SLNASGRAQGSFDGALAVELEHLRVETSSTTWTTDQVAHLKRDREGRIQLADLRLRSELGRIEAAADLDPAQLFRAPANLRLQIEALDLGALAPLLPGLALAGRIDAEVSLAAKSGELDAAVHAKAKELRRFAAAPIDATVDVELHRQRV